MEPALWTAQTLLATIFLVSGTIKVTQSHEAVAAGPMSWAADITRTRFRAVGVFEVLGAVRLIVPGLLHVAPYLTPTAAVGLAVTMAGAIGSRLWHGETNRLAVPVVLFALAMLVAVARFGGYSL